MNSMIPMGHTENGQVAPYNFSMLYLMKDAWQRINGAKATLWGATIIVLVAELFCEGIQHVSPYPFLTNLIATFVLYPLGVGLAMLGVKRSVNIPIRAFMVGDYYSSFFRLAGVLLLKSIIFAIVIFLLAGGFVTLQIILSKYTSLQKDHINILLAVIWGIPLFCLLIYLMLGYAFAGVIAVDKKNVGIAKALRISRKGVSQHWFKVFFIVLFVAVTITISIAPAFAIFMLFIYHSMLSIISGVLSLLLIPLIIWTLPWSLCVIGDLYKIIFGIDDVR